MSDKFPSGAIFYVMRHAETEDNKSGVTSGSASVTVLTENGRKQAIEAGRLVAKIKPHIDRIITSEMHRTIDTAKLLCECNELRDLPRNTDSGINERHYGAAEGMLEDQRQELKKKNGVIEGEEPKEQLQFRTVHTVLNNLRQKAGIPLFVTHGGNIRRLLEYALGKKHVEEIAEYVTNCTLYEFIAPHRDGDKWQVNVLTLGGNNEINRRQFGEHIL